MALHKDSQALSTGHQTAGRRGKTSGLTPDVSSVPLQVSRCLEGKREQHFINAAFDKESEQVREQSKRADKMGTHGRLCTCWNLLFLSFCSAVRFSSKQHFV